MIDVQGTSDFLSKLTNFAEGLYDIEPGDVLTAFMWSVLEDPGLGGLQKQLELAYTSEQLSGTCYGDLDEFFGKTIGIARTSAEQYPYDPFRDQLTSDEWDEVDAKDASYRGRISLFLQAMMRGGTPEGIAMAAEAACAAPCDVVEMWRYPKSVGAIGRFQAPREFVIVPLAGSLTPYEERSVYRTVAMLKPVNSVCTIHGQPPLSWSEVPTLHAAAESYYEVKRYVSAGVVPPARVWLRPGEEVDAPLFAHLRSSEGSWTVNEATQASSWSQGIGYDYRVGSLAADLHAGDAQATVQQVLDTPVAGFKVMIGDEVLTVTGKTPAASGTWTWQLQRGVDATVAADHGAASEILSSIRPLPADVGDASVRWGPRQQIGLADSPDNFPAGQYPGDQSKYAADGTYLFAWPSQAAYVDALHDQVRAQIEAAGPSLTTAQVDDLLAQSFGQGWYAVPASLEPSPGWTTVPEYALAASSIDVRSTWYGGGIPLATGIEGPTASSPAFAASQTTAEPGPGGGLRPGTIPPGVGQE